MTDLSRIEDWTSLHRGQTPPGISEPLERYIGECDDYSREQEGDAETSIASEDVNSGNFNKKLKYEKLLDKAQELEPLDDLDDVFTEMNNSSSAQDSATCLGNHSDEFEAGQPSVKTDCVDREGTPDEGHRVATEETPTQVHNSSSQANVLQNGIFTPSRQSFEQLIESPIDDWPRPQPATSVPEFQLPSDNLFGVFNSVEQEIRKDTPPDSVENNGKIDDSCSIPQKLPTLHEEQERLNEYDKYNYLKDKFGEPLISGKFKKNKNKASLCKSKQKVNKLSKSLEESHEDIGMFDLFLYCNILRNGFSELHE